MGLVDYQQGQRKQFKSGQAITKMGGLGVLPPENFEKKLLAGAFWCYFKGK